jgi:GT2 family glycosyltransferase
MHRNPDIIFAVFRAGVFTNSVGDSGRLYHPQNPGDDLLRFLTLECPWQTSGPVWRRSFLEKSGCFDETLLSMQDLEMHVRAISAGGRYIYIPEVDHDIRGHSDVTKTSARHFYDPDYLQAATKVHTKLLDTVRRSGLLKWTRQRGLVGLAFGTAESWALSGRLCRGVQSWKRSCHEHGAPWHLQIVGVSMLCAARISGAQDGVCTRVVNKWKGWARFRQEPSLLKQTGEILPRYPDDLA